MKCPICGKENTLRVVELTQNSRTYKILKNGTRSKRCTLEKDLFIDDAYFLVCENGCSVNEFAWEFINKKLVIYTDTKFETKNLNYRSNYEDK